MLRHLKASIRGENRAQSSWPIWPALTPPPPAFPKLHGGENFFGKEKKVYFSVCPGKKTTNWCHMHLPNLFAGCTYADCRCVCAHPFAFWVFGCCLLCDCLEWCLKDPFLLLLSYSLFGYWRSQVRNGYMGIVDGATHRNEIYQEATIIQKYYWNSYALLCRKTKKALAR